MHESQRDPFGGYKKMGKMDSVGGIGYIKMQFETGYTEM
jgi:hypothetical protein